MSRPRWGSRAPCASKWVNRWGRHGDLRLVDRSSVPRRSPNATPVWIELVEGWRTEKKWSGQRISHVLAELGFASSSAQFRNVSGSYPTRHRVAAAGAPLRLPWLGQPFSIRRTARSWNSWSYLLGAEMALSLLCHLLCQISTLRDFQGGSSDFTWILGKKSRHQKTKPFRLRHNDKAERYQPIMAEEVSNARDTTVRTTARRDRGGTSATTTIAPTAPPTADRQQRRLNSGVTNVQPSYGQWRSGPIRRECPPGFRRGSGPERKRRAAVLKKVWRKNNKSRDSPTDHR